MYRFWLAFSQQCRFTFKLWNWLTFSHFRQRPVLHFRLQYVCQILVDGSRFVDEHTLTDVGDHVDNGRRNSLSAGCGGGRGGVGWNPVI